jgi:hypothetical protein
MTDADRNALALGKDLTMLGMNLSPGEKLYPNFASPFSETPATKEPHYQVCFTATGSSTKHQNSGFSHLHYNVHAESLLL